MSLPLISCIMPTANRRALVWESVNLFLAQDYPRKELIVVDDGISVAALIESIDFAAHGASARWIGCSEPLTIGRKRNIACAAASGDIIAHWDDDDWYGPQRLSEQAEVMQDSGVWVTGYDEMAFVDEAQHRAWLWPREGWRRPHCIGTSLMYRREHWEENRFQDISHGEDHAFLEFACGMWPKPSNQIVARVHPGNTCPKLTEHKPWREIAWSELPPGYQSLGLKR